MEDKFNTVLQKAWFGNCIAFLGSGFSRGARNLAEQNFKTGKEFQNFLLESCDGPAGSDLGDAAEAYRLAFGAEELVAVLKREFIATTVSEHHRLVARVPWRRVYTTNYDNVFEKACDLEKVKVTAATLKRDPFAERRDRLQCVHLNGSVDGLVTDDLDSILKLTDTSYVSASIAQSPWILTFRHDIALADAVFYIGYSLFDLDIKRVIFESPELKEKSYFILGAAPSALTKQRIERFGSLIEADTEYFASAVSKVAATIPSGDLQLESLSEITSTLTSKSPRDQDLFDLFELGTADRQLVHNSIGQDFTYFLERTCIGKMLTLLERSQAVALTSSLGNGKSLALEGLAYRALERGYRVFIASKLGEKATLEFESIARLEQPSLLIIDDYPTWMKEIRAYGLARTSGAKLVVSARDNIHDVLYDKLEESLGLSSIPEVAIDKLDAQETAWVVETLNRFGLWGDLAARSPREKASIVRGNLGGELHGVLLRLLKSSDIGARVRALADGPTGRCKYLDVVASVFVLAALKTGSPRIEMLSDIWGVELLSSSAFRNDPSIRSLLDFERWTIRARSAVVAEFFLQEVLGHDVVPTLIKIMQALSVGSRAAIIGHRKAFEELMRFSTLQHVLPIVGRLEAAVRFYEGIKDLPQAARHPLFWFQFGIATLAESDLNRARRYFTTAYSLADAQGFDTFQIDNHYARLLLVEASEIKDLSATEAVRNFRDARAIINRQLLQERRTYPFRVASHYQEFFERWNSRLDDNQLQEVLKATDFVVERIGLLDRALKENRYVRQCQAAMHYIRTRCTETAASRAKKISREDSIGDF